MDKIAVIEYKINSDRIMKSYYAKYKANYEEFSKEIFDSIPDSEKEVRIEFFKDRFIKTNLVKNEKNTYLYNEVFCIEKTENGYLFYKNKNDFNFFEFDDFNPEELKELDDILKKYYENKTDNIIVKIEDFEWTEERVKKGILNGNMRFRMAILLLLVIFFIFQIITNPVTGVLVISLAAILGIFIWFIYCLKIYPKRILKSINPNLRKMRALFYKEHMLLINKSEPKIIEVSYSDYYKIKKLKIGYSIYTQRNSFFLFEFSEMTGNIEELKTIFQNIKKEVKNDK